MLKFDPEKLTERQNYKFLTGTVIPRPVAFVTTVSEAGTINGAPFSYFNIVSSEPPMISVSVRRNNGRLKDTARNIKQRGEFVVHIVDRTNVEKVNQTAATLPPDVSEVEKAGLTPVQSDKISVPGVKEAKVRFECRLVEALELGKNGQVGTDLIIGEIVRYHIDENIYYQNGRIDQAELEAVSRLAGHNYATIGEIFTLERPK